MLELKLVSRLADSPLGVPREVALRGPDDEPQAYSWTSDSCHWIELPEIGLICLERGGRAYGMAYGSVDRLLEEFESRALPLALQVLGWEVLHASAVSFPQGVVALCAFSETGKSTTAYAFGTRGHPIWADDAVVLEVPASGPIAVKPLAFRVKLRPEARSHFAGLAEQEANKTAAQSAPLAAVVLLERSEREAVEVKQLHGATALEEVLPHGFRFSITDPERKRRTMENYLRLVSTVPVLRARFPSGLERLSPVIDDLERALLRELDVGEPQTSARA